MKIAVLIPCYNEEKSIAKVITDFRRELPEAEICVFDNNSTDNSARIALDNQAKVLTIKRRGKGFVVKKMFEMVEADIYVMVDGDDTYFANDIHNLIKPVLDDDADMVIGKRSPVNSIAMKQVNKLGNFLFTKMLSFCFANNISDVLSGYRAMSRDFVKEIPILTHEFQVEMEMTIQAVYRKMRVMEVPVGYKARPKGAFSKLHPLKDGSLILLTLLALVRDLRPLALFGFISIMLMIGVLVYGALVYYRPGDANLLDSIIIISFLFIAFFFLSMGLFLHAINRRFLELNTLIKKKSAS